MSIKKFLAAFFIATASAVSVNAQSTYDNLELITVNEQVTTLFTASEPITLVDVSTGKVDGDIPLPNTLRIKPNPGEYEDGSIIGIVTIVTERYRVQYGLVYTKEMTEAVTDKNIEVRERIAYNNPAVSMSTQDMYTFARKVWNSPAKIRNIGSSRHKMKMQLNNVYAVGEYFFIDFSVYNETNIRFDIDEIRLSLCDKKVQKTTNNQIIELTPALILEKAKSFKKGYRNVVVVKKMTFPSAKVLTIEMSEKQISGRSLKMTIDYEDILCADSFDSSILVTE